MNMNLLYKLMFTSVVLMGVSLLVANLRSHMRLARLENQIEETKRFADEQKHRGDELEKQAFIYKEKAAYLENQLTRIQAAAREQDETLEKLATDTSAARRDLDRLRRSAK